MIRSHDLCKMCRERPAGAKSHIVPRALCLELGPEDNPLLLVSGDPNVREVTRRTGSYDFTIMCHECERRFGWYDDHGVAALRTVLEPAPSSVHPELRVLPGIDGRRLKLFFMHVLWRAHASGIPDFKYVKLGHRGEVLRRLLLGDDPGRDGDFPLMLVRYANGLEGGRGVLLIHTNRWPQPPPARLCEIQIGPWVAVVTTSANAVPKALLPGTIRPGRPVVTLTEPGAFHENRHFKLCVEIMRRRQAANMPSEG